MVATDPLETAPALHPDDGHAHRYGCRLCGVDALPSRPSESVVSEWRTYRGWARRGVGWLDDLDDPVARGRLRREVHRLAHLVESGEYYHDMGPIPPNELADLRHDLDLWSDPARVLDLVRSPAAREFVGDKTRPRAVASLERLIAARGA